MERRGTDWYSNDGTGRTLHIGSRISAKYVRIYEKGKQLGDLSSLWVRFEIEFKKAGAIPLDILIRPDVYFRGAYPICERLIGKGESKKIVYKKKLETFLFKRLQSARIQNGKLIRFLYDSGVTKCAIVDLPIAPENQYPKNLNPIEDNCRDLFKRMWGQDQGCRRCTKCGCCCMTP